MGTSNVAEWAGFDFELAGLFSLRLCSGWLLDLLIFLSSKYWQNVSRDKVARK
jgi:hypothetical protein